MLSRTSFSAKLLVCLLTPPETGELKANRLLFEALERWPAPLRELAEQGAVASYEGTWS